MEKTVKIKKSLITFLLLCFGLSAIFYYLIISKGMVETAYLLMWCPGLAAIIVSLLFHRKENLLLFRGHPLRYTFLVLLLPLIWWGISYGIYILTFGKSVITGNSLLELIKQPSTLILTLVIYFITAMGEEIGWRGYLVTQLNALFGFKKGALINGIIWSLWHSPLFLSGYVSTIPLWYQAPIYVLQMVAASYVMYYLSLKTNSVWPAVGLHFLDNFISQVILDPSIGGDMRTFLVGETGILSLIVMIIVAGIIIRKQSVQNTGALNFL